MSTSSIGAGTRSAVPDVGGSTPAGAAVHAPELDLRTSDSGTRESYSRTHHETVHDEYYGDSSHATGEPNANFIAAEKSGHDRVAAAAQAGNAATFHWTAADHRTDHEWMWQVPVGGAAGLGVMFGAATVASGLSKAATGMRALHPVGFWAGALGLGALAGVATFLGTQHFFDGRHQSWDGRPAPTGTVEAPTAATSFTVPKDITSLEGRVAWTVPTVGHDNQETTDVHFGGPLGNLAGYESSAAAVDDLPSNVSGAVVKSTSGRYYAVELHLDSPGTEVSSEHLPTRDLGGDGGRGPQWLTWFSYGKDSNVKKYRKPYEAALSALPTSVTSLVWLGPFASSPASELQISHATGGTTYSYSVVVPGRDDTAGGYPPAHVVAHWAQSGKTTGTYRVIDDYGNVDVDHGNVVASDELGPVNGYATEAEALSDIAARPGDQVIVQQGDRFHVYRTQDGPVLSGQDMLGLETVAEVGPAIGDAYNHAHEWNNSKWGTPVALEELGITTFAHQGWWLTAGRVQDDATGIGKDS